MPQLPPATELHPPPPPQVSVTLAASDPDLDEHALLFTEILDGEPFENDIPPSPPTRVSQTLTRVDGPRDGTMAQESGIPDMEVHTPTPRCKHRRLVSPQPPSLTPMPLLCSGMPALFPATPGSVQAQVARTPLVVGVSVCEVIDAELILGMGDMGGRWGR